MKRPNKKQNRVGVSYVKIFPLWLDQRIRGPLNLKEIRDLLALVSVKNLFKTRWCLVEIEYGFRGAQDTQGS